MWSAASKSRWGSRRGQDRYYVEAKFVETQIPNGKKITKWPIYEDVLSADVLINAPIAKNHSLTKLTLGMKNLMGVVQNRKAYTPALDSDWQI